MSQQTDEEEHSIEMHLPYIAKVMEGKKGMFTIIPVMVGATSHQRQTEYGRIFSTYLADPENLFVISSDFCHWGEHPVDIHRLWRVCIASPLGKRFRFTSYDKSKGSIHSSIEALDKTVG